MNTNNKNENKPVPALMRKTKVQLIDIILRKDNIECNLRNDIKSKDETIMHNKCSIFRLYIWLVASFIIILCLCCL